MAKKKQTPFFLPLFLDAAGKDTFQPVRYEDEFVEKEVDGEKKMVKQKILVMNASKNDKNGKQIDKPINRKARRIHASIARKHAKRFKEVEPVAVVASQENE